METFGIKRGDTSPGLEYRLGIYEEGSAVLSGASVRFLMKRGSIALDEAATVDDEDGIVRYAWNAGDTATEGVYQAEFEVTYSDGSVETFPGDGWIIVSIGRDLG